MIWKERRTCGECAHHRQLRITGSICNKKLMAVLPDMHVGYMEKEGSCWEAKPTIAIAQLRRYRYEYHYSSMDQDGLWPNPEGEWVRYVDVEAAFTAVHAPNEVAELLEEADTILSVINPDCRWRADYKRYKTTLK